MDLPERIVDDLLVSTDLLLAEEFARVRDGAPETVRLPEFELLLYVLLLFTDCLLFVLP